MQGPNCIPGIVLTRRISTDYDPEADVVPSDSDRSGDESSDNEPAGTEHYVAVGYAISQLAVRSRARLLTASLARASSVATSP